MINIEALLRFIKDDFIDFVENTMTPKVHLARGDALKITADFILKKSTKTLKAICDLCSKDYGEDAQILARTIFENALSLTFIYKPDSKETKDWLARCYILHAVKEKQNRGGLFNRCVKIIQAAFLCRLIFSSIITLSTNLFPE